MKRKREKKVRSFSVAEFLHSISGGKQKFFSSTSMVKYQMDLSMWFLVQPDWFPTSNNRNDDGGNNDEREWVGWRIEILCLMHEPSMEVDNYK